MGKDGIVCPAFTKSRVIDGEEHCVYTSLAYGILATVLVVIFILMILLVYCCFLRWRSKRRNEYARHGSHDTTSIGEYPYQPIARNAEGYSNYGTVDSGIDDVRSPSQSQSGSIAERLSQQHDTSSVASSRASMNPNYDEASLNQRSTIIANRPRVPTPELSSRLDQTDRANADRRGSSLSTGSQRKTPQSKPDAMYASVDVTDFASSKPLTGQRGAVRDGTLGELSSADGPDYAVLEEPEVGSTKCNQSNSKDIDENQKQNQDTVDYAILEPPLPDIPGVCLSGNNMDGNTDNLSPAMAGNGQQGFSGNLARSPGSKESLEEERYLPLLPPRQYPTNEVEDGQEYMSTKVSSESDNDAGEPRKRLESRADYEEFLLDQLRNVPDTERNGAFIVRESVSTPGCKVLTVFCKKPGSDKEMYNFKICFSDAGVHLSKGKAYFPDVDSLLHYLMENQDMLPCVLSQQLYIDYGNAVA